MPRKKKPQRRKLNKHRAGSTSNSERHFKWMPSPFEGMTREEADKAFIQIGEENAKEFENTFAELQTQILKYDPTFILAANSYYSTFDSNLTKARRAEAKRILQFHIELLQALVLTNSFETYQHQFAPPPVIHHIRELLHQCSSSFSIRRFSTLEMSMGAEERQRLRLLEDVRTHTQSLRNWGYPQQVFRIVTELFKPLDDSIEDECGVRVQNLMAMVFRIMEIIEERINAHVTDLRPALTSSTIKRSVDKYFRSFLKQESGAEELIAVLDEHSATLKQARLMLIGHSDLFLQDIYTIQIDDFVMAYDSNVDDGTLKQIINSWTYSFGDLGTQNREHFFMGNPIWTRPLINLGADTYFLAVPGLFLSFCLEMMEP